MTKSELVQAMQGKYPHINNQLVEGAVNLFFHEIGVCLQRGWRIELRGFGSFSLRQRNSRQGRNPRTGEVVEVVEKTVPFFKPGKAFRERLNDSYHVEQNASALQKKSKQKDAKKKSSLPSPDVPSLHNHQYGNR